ncbi:MAG: galactokinase [Chlorobi bacterium]|nr:galactokinase [Chlorobiota bacterium]
MTRAEFEKVFYSMYGLEDKSPSGYFAPGRVNLIGEHTDYNGGYVFPCSLSFGTYLLIRPNKRGTFRFASTNFSFTAEIGKHRIREKVDNEWVNYPLGIVNEMISRRVSLKGADFLYHGDIPNGAGLSSSASIEVVTAYALNDLSGKHISNLEIVKLSQHAENAFVGMNCGIMDQFAVAMGRAGKAVFLNCNTLDYELVPLELKDYRLVITNTNKERKLTDSKYNERRAECEQAVKYLQKGKPIRNLGELSLAEFESLAHLIPDETIFRRARHVVSEDARVLEAVATLRDGNLEHFGKLMYASHDSLRDDYEVTGIELDTLVNGARKIEGVIGSRMTGAGFGGCTVSLVHQDRIQQFRDKLGLFYHQKTGLEATFYVAEVRDGMQKWE